MAFPSGYTFSYFTGHGAFRRRLFGFELSETTYCPVSGVDDRVQDIRYDCRNYEKDRYSLQPTLRERGSVFDLILKWKFKVTLLMFGVF